MSLRELIIGLYLLVGLIFAVTHLVLMWPNRQLLSAGVRTHVWLLRVFVYDVILWPVALPLACWFKDWR